MGKFSNHCNNRFRGAFKHAVNQSIKEYENNKQYDSVDYSSGLSDELMKIILKITIFLVLCGGNFLLFFSGQHKYLLENDLFSISFVFLTAVLDIYIFYLGSKKLCERFFLEKISGTIGKIIFVVLLLAFIGLIVYSYIPHCYFCNKLVLSGHEFLYEFKICETCYSEQYDF